MRNVLKRAVPLLAVVAALAVALPATAATTSLRVIGSARSSGDFAVAAANGSRKNAKAVYVRGYGRSLSGFAAVACSKGFSVGSKSTTLSRMSSGELYKLRLPFAGDCDVTASLSGSGSIRLQILAA
jgi:hypothetical protein